MESAFVMNKVKEMWDGASHSTRLIWATEIGEGAGIVIYGFDELTKDVVDKLVQLYHKQGGRMTGEIKTVTSVLDKYFAEERIKYFHSSDAHQNIEGDTYLRYDNNGDRIELWFGGDNGEVCLIVTKDAEKLDQIITGITR
jgi:hypothetical protein